MITWKKYYSKFMKISSINAGLFIAYKLYAHYRKNKLTYLNLGDYSPKLNFTAKSLDFTNHNEMLKNLDFVTVKNNTENFSIACFQYRDIYFSFKKNNTIKNNIFNLDFDIETCINLEKEPHEMIKQFVNALELNEVPETTNNSIKLEFEKIIKNLKIRHLKSQIPSK